MTRLTFSHYEAYDRRDIPGDHTNEVAVAAELVCANCQNDSPFWIFDDCKKCSAACIVANPGPWNSNRKFYESRPECAELDREIERQKSALAQVEAA
jgi:hypothetical protein